MHCTVTFPNPSSISLKVEGGIASADTMFSTEQDTALHGNTSAIRIYESIEQLTE